MWVFGPIFLRATKRMLSNAQNVKQHGIASLSASQNDFSSPMHQETPSFHDQNSKDDVADEKIKYYLSKKVEDAFTIALSGCTGSLVGENWIITAGHCSTSLYGAE